MNEPKMNQGLVVSTISPEDILSSDSSTKIVDELHPELDQDPSIRSDRFQRASDMPVQN